MSQVEFSPMQAADLDRVVAIEQAAFSHPWSRALFADALNSYQCWVMRVDGEQVGHAVLQMILDEAHLLNITVAPAWQGRGLGLRLLQQIMQEAGHQGACECFLEVRASNQQAYRLYERYGFNEVGRRRDYYPAAQGGREDALVMVCTLLD